ncbi:LysR family transcriptional regulator [Sandaracinus amylolyticus]|uniref:LysR family regulatory protein CidR n=1 Tax=Sandaracinus amylolyticus TaxID=927083 RepID=A0A0F6W895_9BACT|nr:LysR substrate-binding domain-containing protein [Sandaracinus amylolyticus]AKF09936.1 LysR family regulatory protein CidR [Sandaracinus amylolyticus]
MDIRRLHAFVVLAEELHFGRAARRLHVSQPPLSIAIRKLEDELEVRLFERDSRNVALTEAGKALLGRARHLVAESARATDEARRVARGEAGVLSVAYTPTATYEILPRVIAAFRRAHPDIALELREMRSPDQVAAIDEGRVELGIACLPLEGDLETRVLATESLVAALPSRHRLAKKTRVDVSELKGEPFVIVRPDVEPAWAGAVARALAKHGVGGDVVQETDTKIAMLGLVAAGVGVSVVSSSMRVLERRGVVMRPVAGVGVRLRIGVVSRPDRSARAQAFLDAC